MILMVGSLEGTRQLAQEPHASQQSAPTRARPGIGLWSPVSSTSHSLSHPPSEPWRRVLALSLERNDPLSGREGGREGDWERGREGGDVGRNRR